MTKGFYFKFAAQSIRKNQKTYLPYILTCIGAVMMFYIISAMSANPDLTNSYGGRNLKMILNLGTWVVGIFAAVFLYYTNSFLIKRRKKEFGVYNILGMEKKHIALVMLLETAYVTLMSLFGGLLAGVLLNKLCVLLVHKLLQTSASVGFHISFSAMGSTAVLFLVIFALILLKNIRQIHTTKPVELLRGGEMGEREPKTRWLAAVLGVLCLGGGYAISILTENPLAAIMLFFVAVLLVIAGTFLLFSAGSTAVLKAMRKNKRYYYQTRHFVSVSGMIYRMKQNAAGLSNICILSTMVLVMISGTVCLYLGTGETVESRYPRQICMMNISALPGEEVPIQEAAAQVLQQKGLSAENVLSYSSLQFTAFRQGNDFELRAVTDDTASADGLTMVTIMTAQDVASFDGSDVVTLNENEALVYTERFDYPAETFTLAGEKFSVRQKLEVVPGGNGSASTSIYPFLMVIVKDYSVLQKVDGLQRAFYGEHASTPRYTYAFDVAGSTSEIRQAIADELRELRESNELACEQITGKDEGSADLYSLYGAMFFLGIFLGLLFIMATVLIIYYKQVSEGYDDKERFRIMQKVGMDRTEVKRAIHSQVITVFFLPLVTAGIHILFAFPIIVRLLNMLSMNNVSLFALCSICCFALFALLYAFVYSFTARAYYQIVSEK